MTTLTTYSVDPFSAICDEEHKKKQADAKNRDLLEDLKHYYCYMMYYVGIVDLGFYSVILRLRFVASQARVSDNSCCTRCPSYNRVATKVRTYFEMRTDGQRFFV